MREREGKGEGGNKRERERERERVFIQYKSINNKNGSAKAMNE